MSTDGRRRVEAWPVRLPGLVKPGDDLAAMLAQAADLRPGDVVAVSSTVVAKAEGRAVALAEVEPGAEARRIARRNRDDPRFVEVVLREASEVLIESPFLLVRTRFGAVCPNAGVDRSNTEPGTALRHPADPDRSARGLRSALERRAGKPLAVVVTDTCGRPFRLGQAGAALGLSGFAAITDWRGRKDLHGNLLEVKQEAVADELAALGNFLMGESSEGTPAAVIRGHRFAAANGGAKALHRPVAEDIVRRALLHYKDGGRERGQRAGRRPV
ncbi:MAG: coenzyme F420-0:L-glutamate ligase [Halobacteria archaeon]